MSKKFTFLLLILISLTTTTSALAQANSNPTVAIVLLQPTAQEGDTIPADVYIRNAVNLGGADVGITVDSQCLKIVDRQPGTFLPSTADKGGFSPFSELHDNGTRFAAAVTDRTKIANGDGVFYHTQLKVICAKGSAALTVSFAQLASYKDPTAKDIQLISYKLESGTVNTVNAILSIGPAGQVTAIPTQTLAPTPIPAIAPTATPALVPVTATSESTSSTTIILVVMAIVILILIIVIILLARRRRS